jgi:hypothetical protein
MAWLLLVLPMAGAPAHAPWRAVFTAALPVPPLPPTLFPIAGPLLVPPMAGPPPFTLVAEARPPPVPSMAIGQGQAARGKASRLVVRA